MGTTRPRSLPWDPELQEPQHGWVLKREFSDAARHVYVPDYPLRDDRTSVRKEKKRVRQFLGKGNARGDLGDIQWLAQEYVPTLVSLGELRFMCVDGEPVRMVITGDDGPGKPDADGTWSMEGIRTMLGLGEIR